MNEIILNNMVSKTKDCNVFPILVETITMIITFDLRMPRGRFNTFALVANYINSKWKPCHIS
jgi:hypothetical protein